MVELLGHVGITDKYICAIVKLFHSYRDSMKNVNLAYTEYKADLITRGDYFACCRTVGKYRKIIEELNLMDEYNLWEVLNK